MFSLIKIKYLVQCTNKKCYVKIICAIDKQNSKPHKCVVLLDNLFRSFHFFTILNIYIRFFLFEIIPQVNDTSFKQEKRK